MGLYVYVGLQECIQRVLEEVALEDDGIVLVQLHTNGLSPFSNPPQQLWPIFVRTVAPCSRVFLDGLLGGFSGPHDNE